VALGKGWHSAKTLLPSATLSKAGKQNFFSFFQLISLQRGRNSISVNIYSSHISHKPSHSHHISSINTKYPSQSIKVSINAHSPSQYHIHMTRSVGYLLLALGRRVQSLVSPPGLRRKATLPRRRATLQPGLRRRAT